MKRKEKEKKKRKESVVASSRIIRFQSASIVLPSRYVRTIRKNKLQSEDTFLLEQFLPEIVTRKYVKLLENLSSWSNLIIEVSSLKLDARFLSRFISLNFEYRGKFKWNLNHFLNVQSSGERKSYTKFQERRFPVVNKNVSNVSILRGMRARIYKNFPRSKVSSLRGKIFFANLSRLRTIFFSTSRNSSQFGNANCRHFDKPRKRCVKLTNSWWQ